MPEFPSPAALVAAGALLRLALPSLLTPPLLWIFGVEGEADPLEKKDKLWTVVWTISVTILPGWFLVYCGLFLWKPPTPPPSAAFVLVIPTFLLAILFVDGTNGARLLRRACGETIPASNQFRFRLGISLPLRPIWTLLPLTVALQCLYSREGELIRPGMLGVTAYFAAVLVLGPGMIPWLRLIGAIAPLERAGIPGGGSPRLACVPRFYVQRTFGNRFANAFALRFSNAVLVTDRLLGILTPEEAHAILLHEAGHLARSKERRFAAGTLAVVAAMVFSLAPLIASLGGEFDGVAWAYLGILSTGVVWVIADKGRRREAERHADAYAAADPVGAAHFGVALRKLHADNWIPLRLEVGKDRGSHPTLEHRLEKLGGGAPLSEAEKGHLERARKRYRRTVRVTVLVVALPIWSVLAFCWWADQQFMWARQAQRSGRLFESERHYRRYLSWRPDDPLAHYDFALVLLEEARDEDALLEARRALDLAPHDGKSQKLCRMLEERIQRAGCGGK